MSKSKRPPVYMRVRELVDPDTGEMMKALIPASMSDDAQPEWAKVRIGERVRVELARPRNPRFHRLGHALGKLVSENIDAFQHLDAHSSLKRLQVEGGIECDEVLIDATVVWSHLARHVTAAVPETRNVMGMIQDLLIDIQLPMRWPRSMSFDSMDETRFHSFMEGIYSLIATKYWPGCSPDEIERMAIMNLERR